MAVWLSTDTGIAGMQATSREIVSILQHGPDKDRKSRPKPVTLGNVALETQGAIRHMRQ